MTVKIDNLQLETCDSYLLAYKYTEGKITSKATKSRYRSNMLAPGITSDAGTLTLGIAIHSDDLEEQYRAVQGAFVGGNVHEVEIDDNGKKTFYKGVLNEFRTVGNSTKTRTISITLKAIKHGELVTTESGEVNCLSTVPYTDCIVTVSNLTAGTLEAAGVKFASVDEGDVVRIDSINMTITISGQMAADRAEFSKMPRLVPGLNIITASQGDVTVEYFPTFL